MWPASVRRPHRQLRSLGADRVPAIASRKPHQLLPFLPGQQVPTKTATSGSLELHTGILYAPHHDPSRSALPSHTQRCVTRCWARRCKDSRCTCDFLLTGSPGSSRENATKASRENFQSGEICSTPYGRSVRWWHHGGKPPWKFVDLLIWGDKKCFEYLIPMFLLVKLLTETDKRKANKTTREQF